MYKIIKNSKGFSLLEVMVTVGIMAVISAVAVPAYNGYRKTAAQGTLFASLGNIERAYQACNIAGSGVCDSLEDIGLGGRCEGCGNPVSPVPPGADMDFCMTKKQKIGANIYVGCVAISERTGRSMKTIAAYNKVVSSSTKDHDNSSFCGCDISNTIASPLRECKVASDCSGCDPSATPPDDPICIESEGKCDTASLLCL